MTAPARKQSTNKAILAALDGIVDGLNKLGTRVESLEEKPRVSGFAVGTSTDAKDNLVSFTKGHESQQEVEQDLSREMNSRGDAMESLPSEPIETFKVLNKSKLEMEMFMEEVLEIIVHDTTDPNADPIPHVCVNGVNQYFIRGQRQQVKRKYVQLLFRPKTTTFGLEMFKNAVGDDAYRYPAHTAPEIQATIIHDPSGSRGLAWLDGLRAEAA